MSSLLPLIERVPDGWSSATYDGRRYGVTKTLRADGRAVSVYAEELGGTDVVSTNVYLTGDSVELRPCEMPAEKVLAFLRDAAFDQVD
ncbi:peptide methionine sulfoxide reductase [Nocardioides sp. Root1257]|nr:peptide methionine sulfoxide reductase [Nocardioides sp. Root1257]KRC45325.1 peptide methionine sulfoxide reductase [Nocardioides sp. Root224]